MTQPAFVPIAESDQVRPALRLETPRPWEPRRPAEVQVPRRAVSPLMGTPGPDQGFALRLAHRFAERLRLVEGESIHDVELGLALLASRRAALFGRAPCVHDVRAMLALWGFDEKTPAEGLLEDRVEAFRGVAHDYPTQRVLVGRIPDETMRLTPEQIAGRVGAGEWRELTGWIPEDPAPSGHVGATGGTASSGETGPTSGGSGTRTG